ncbi:phosphotransferase [Ramlibacter sp. GTP1]|uniref:Phosphotransferase n=2 Tax=Ramlibacter albus TaxID=2079448 RepID=A0A923M822_9BURK|nr:phosphotransferase [Ramlibacter albus]
MRHIFLALGLAAPAEDVHATALAGGVSSGIYRVDLRSGSYCVKQALPKLKVAKEWLVPVERVFSEIAYLKAVDAIAPGHVPRVLGQDEASKSFVMEFLGPEYRNWKADLLAGRVDPNVAAQVGALLGRVHAATADDPDVARRFATDANFHAIRLEPYLLETAKAHPALADKLAQLVHRTAETRRVLVHGDVSPKNILLGPNGPVLLDAECAWFGDPAFDVAFCLNHFVLKAVHVPELASVLLESFDAFVDAYLLHVDWEPQNALERRVGSLLPALTLARVDGKSPVEYLAEDRRERVRNGAIPIIVFPLHSPHEVASHWRKELAG